jgi:hypothetical protein
MTGTMTGDTYAALVAQFERQTKIHAYKGEALRKKLLASMLAEKRSNMLCTDMSKYGEKTPLRSRPELELTQALYSAFDDEQYSDISIKCKDKTFKVHKLIICNRCEFFKKACEGAFQVSMHRLS